jgi:hypothetical protein
MGTIPSKAAGDENPLAARARNWFDPLGRDRQPPRDASGGVVEVREVRDEFGNEKVQIITRNTT